MAQDQYPPIVGINEQQAYTRGWRDRRDRGAKNPPPMDHPDRMYLRGWMEAHAAIVLGRNIGQGQATTPPATVAGLTDTEADGTF
jgi:hypothetical protein